MSVTSDSSDSSDPLQTAYSVRLSERAQREIDSEVVRIAQMQGVAIARQWRDGLYDAVGTLSRNPGRNAILEQESRWMKRAIRRLLYRRAAGSAGYLLYYSVADTGADGPQVEVIHVRHGAQRPLTQKEARQMRSEL